MNNPHALMSAMNGQSYGSQEKMMEAGLQLADKWERFPMLQERQQGRGIRGIAEGKEMVDFIQGVTDPQRRSLLGHLFENAYNYLCQLDETTKSLQVGNYEKYVFPIIRMTYANLVAANLVSFQSLGGPQGFVFYLNVIAGSTKGAINKGDSLLDSKSGPTATREYSSELVSDEDVATANGILTNFTGNVDYIPVRPGTVKITNGTLSAVDDGNGNLTGDVNGGGNNTFNYATGAYDITFSSAPANATEIVVTYEYDSESSDLIPEVELSIQSSPVTARPHKLRARMSMESQFGLQSTHGLNGQVELVGFMSNQIAQDINYSIVHHLRQIAYNNTVSFDSTAPSGVPYRDHKFTLQDSIVETSNQIFTATQRFSGTWLVVGVGVANILETLNPVFTPVPKAAGVTGIHKIGMLGGMDVYKDPTYPTSEWLIGFKGASMIETGYVHAVFQGLIATPEITLDDFTSRRGVMTMTAKKVVNNRFYARGTVTSS